MKTKERILITSLTLFNELGEPNVTTVDVSNEMDISPGNLYYHYRNKDDIIEHIVTQYDQEISGILSAKTELEGLVEHWLFLKVILETNWRYRFIFRDFENLSHKYKNVGRKLSRLQNRFVKAMQTIISSLTQSELEQRVPYLEQQAENLTFILSRLPMHAATGSSTPPSTLITYTCFQTLLVVYPWLSDEDQAMLQELSTSCF